MKGIAIITDSACDLPESYIREHENLFVLPLRLVYPEATFRCGVDITPDEVYARMEKNEVPTTTLPSPEDVQQVFETLRERNIRQAVFVMMSAGLSGTYNMVRLLCEDHPEVETYVYDSGILSMGLGYMVMNAVELAEQGAAWESYPSRLAELRKNVDGFFYLGSLDYLIRGGRIGLVAGTVGKLLNLRPIIACNEEGKYYTRAACIGMKKIVRTAVKLVEDFVGNRKFETTVMSGNAFAEAQNLLGELKKLPGLFASQILQLGPSLAVHTGPNMIAVLVRTQG